MPNLRLRGVILSVDLHVQGFVEGFHHCKFENVFFCGGGRVATGGGFVVAPLKPGWAGA